MARKCRICHQSFAPTRAMQPTCLRFECQVEYASRVAKRSAAKRMAAERQALRVRKEQIKRTSDLRKEAQEEFTRYHEQVVEFLRGGHAARFLWKRLGAGAQAMMDSILGGFDE